MNENENNNKINNVEDIADVSEIKKKKKSGLRDMFEWVVCIAVAMAVALLLKNFVFFVAEVDGNSMLDTLHDKERLITWKLGYEPKNNDIVIFEPKSSDSEHRKFYVKRVIATEGQTVKIDYDEDAVYVDGEKLDEPYIYEKDMQMHFTDEAVMEWTVPEGHVFVMGDNRNNSSDSRDGYSVGYVNEKDILGKAVLRFWPLNKIGVVK